MAHVAAEHGGRLLDVFPQQHHRRAHPDHHEDEVRERQSTTREFVITGCSKDPYPFDDESTITAAELSQLMSDRELYLATMKKNQEEWRKNAGSGSAAAPSNDTAGYNF